MSKLQRINSFVTGVLMLAFCIVLLMFQKNGYYVVVYIYAAGVAYGGFVKIVSALRKTSEVYIQ